MRLREYAVHADYAQNPLPHEPNIKAKNEEFWRFGGDARTGPVWDPT